MIRFFAFSLIMFLANGQNLLAQSITVTSPNGGETLTGGSSFSISWTSSGVTNVTIEYSINGGVNWTTIATNVPTPGSYSWSVPSSPTTQALIRVKKNTTSDISNTFFFIKFGQFNSTDTVKLMPIGNSITFDSFRAEFRFAQDKISYRSVLWDSLRSNNYNTDFIGHRLGGYYQFPDPNSNGIPGITDDQMADFISSGYDPVAGIQVTSGNYLNSYTPNVVLLHIGTNGVNDVGGTSAADVQDILNLIDAKSTNIWVVLALIINQVPNSPNVTTFNNNVQSMARARINSGDKILIVNMQTDAGLVYTIDPTPPFSGDMFDGIHPNDSGKKKMADLWFKALRLILPASTTSSPQIFSPADSLGYVGLPYKYDVNATGVGAPNYSLVTFPSGMTINSKTGIISWIPADTGSYPVSVKAYNSSGENIQNFNLVVLPQPVLTNGLVSYWNLNENGSPSALKDLPGINDARPIGLISSTPGLANNALSFNGNSRVEVLDDSSLYFYPSESISVEMWVKTTQTGAGDKIFLGKDGGYTKFTLGMNASNQAKFEIEDSTDAVTNVLGPAINDGNWHHLVGVLERENNRLRIYVDGIRYTTVKSFQPSGFFSYDPLTLGCFEYGNYFNGSLDEVAIYNRTLTQAEVNDHYNRGITYKKGYFDQFVLAKLKIFLEGPYNPINDGMSTTLKDNNYIPLTSPYAQDPRTVDSIPSGVVDWVLVEVRSSTNGGDTIGYRSAFLKSDGMIVGDDGTSENIILDVPPSNYYIVIKHRNHLAVMSNNKITLNDYLSPAVIYDFTTAANKFYGTNGAKEIESGIWGMWAGDVNGDGALKYNLSNNDRALILQKIGGSDINAEISGYYPEDVNMDGTVKYNLSNNDRAKILLNVGGFDINAIRTSQVP